MVSTDIQRVGREPNPYRQVRGCRSQWPRGLRRRSVAARLLRLWVRIPPGGMDVCLL